MSDQISILEKDSAKKALLSFLESFHTMSSELRSAISSSTYLQKANKKDILLDIHEVQKSLFFIVKGLVRTYYLDSFGRDATSWLLFEGDVAISVYSFFSQKRSFEVLEAVEDTSFLVLSHEKLMQLYQQFPEFNYIGRILTENYYIKAEEKANELRVFSATERYQHLIQKYPNIIARVPLGMISSYLGITQSTLSRIRSKKPN
ncbi:Crp/Fnr family transcriptional regulator [Chryseobacterium camelliae]|uniref:Crp/Fnr family transcriptional regulator n=1 Tax=Chryseobacterium camelliae TaxID=1265445 RepID=UPI001AEB3CD5|nr:Crp/Fnr family transcriptional regulator [Chryseobacterium camelliae]MDR6513753.1 CRP-like cAMP-binding protein [Chryseobacterium camelliae]